MDKFLTRDEILEAQDLPFEDVNVPEWGGTVRIAGLTAKASTEFSTQMISMDAKGQVKAVKLSDNFMSDLLAKTIVDENFKPVFRKEDIEALGEKSAKVVSRLTDVAMRLSGLGEEAAESAEKN